MTDPAAQCSAQESLTWRLWKASGTGAVINVVFILAIGTWWTSCQESQLNARTLATNQQAAHDLWRSELLTDLHTRLGGLLAAIEDFGLHHYQTEPSASSLPTEEEELEAARKVWNQYSYSFGMRVRSQSVTRDEALPAWGNLQGTVAKYYRCAVIENADNHGQCSSLRTQIDTYLSELEAATRHQYSPDAFL